MVETKSVKVDNWGVFFLQKLQNFFNKTDYCDLTLQFMDNSQLKVHRLVLSACTDYFNVLEQQTDCADDILNMPFDLQADVVVPIVNFMYTGTLEFEVNMYGRLLKTAKDMNMTVLLKLLEAHKRSVDVQPARAPPVLLNKGASAGAYHRGGATAATFGRAGANTTAAQQQQQRYAAQQQLQRKSVAPPPPQQQQRQKVAAVGSNFRQMAGSVGSPTGVVRKVEQVRQIAKVGSRVAPTRGPSRFDAEPASGTGGDQFESSFDNISYESRPLITARQIVKEESDDGGDASSHSFEQLRRGYTGVKRPAAALQAAARDSPPEKKPNIEDVKEYIEAHRMRKKIVEEYNEDDDDEDETEEAAAGTTVGSGRRNTSGTSEDNVDHQKIISEVLKKYPHLVKSNKNIKLKITQKGQQQTIMAPLRKPTATTVTASTTLSPKTSAGTVAVGSSNKPDTAVKSAAVAAAAAKPVPSTATAASAPKKIDSKTMHALIAKGAENTTGPWLCLKCGINGRPISIPSYKGFRRHLINVHKLKIDPKLCEHCGWRSAHKTELHHHVLVVHNIAPPADVRFPKCAVCAYVAVDNRDLRQHQMDVHAKAPAAKTSVAAQQQQHCIYCNRTFGDEARLFEHIKSQHKEHACEDGLMEDEDDSPTQQQQPQQQQKAQRDRNDEEEDDDDEHDDDNDDEDYVPPKSVTPVSEKRKINVLSSITFPSKAKTTPIVASTPSSNTSRTTADEQPSWSSSRRSGILDPVTGTFAEDDDDDDSSPQHDENAGDTSTASNKTAPGQQISQEEADSNAYLEFVMAEVHGEKKPAGGDASKVVKATTSATTSAESPNGGDAHFVTEEGAAVELTEEQKKDLIDQLHDQSGVVMILKDDALTDAATIADVSGAAAATTDTTATTNTAVAETAANDSFGEAMEWDILVPEAAGETKETDSATANTTKSSSAAASAKELIGEWSADDETDDSMLDDGAEGSKAVADESPAKAEEVGSKSATKVAGSASGTDEDATVAVKKDAANAADGEQSNNSSATAARRSYGGSRGSRDSNKDVSDSQVIDSKPASSATSVQPPVTKSVAAASSSHGDEEDGDSSSIDEPKRDAETMKKDSNIEIKTLINDWGDDDEDDPMDKE